MQPVQVQLLALVGLAPAVVSETAWALSRTGVEICSVSLLTTAAAAPQAQATLLGPHGALAGALQPQPLPPVELQIIGDKNRSVHDLRTLADHNALLQCLDAILRRLTAPGTPSLHASLAGGRKTMAAALGLAMAIHARPQDRMSHVLVAPPYDSDPAFLFPLPGDAAAESAVTLIDVPFSRLRALLPDAPATLGAAEVMGLAQCRLEAGAPAVLDLAARTLSLGGTSLILKPIGAALAAFLAEASAVGGRGLSPRELDLARLAALYRQAGGGPAAVALARTLSRDGPDVWLREHLSRLRKELRVFAGALAIVRDGARPLSRYRLLGAPVIVLEANSRYLHPEVSS